MVVGKPDAKKPSKSTKVESFKKEEAVAPVSHGSGGKPDRAVYEREQDGFKKEIDALNVKLSEVRNKINAFNGKDGDAEKRAQLKSELDSIKGEQAKNKGSKQKILDQIKALQDANQKKIKDLQTAKSKSPYKSAAEIDNAIKSLEKKVESGSMKLVEEKRALQEITTLKKSKKNFESFDSQQAEIDSNKSEIESLRQSIDDPNNKSQQDRYTQIKSELDAIYASQDEKNKQKDVLFEERNKLQKQLDEAYGNKRESAAAFKAANDRYYQKMQEDRQRRIERQKAEKAKQEEERLTQLHAQWRDEASTPAFGGEIEDCKNLIDFFNKLRGGGNVAAPKLSIVDGVDSERANLPKLDIRTVDTSVPQGATALKKKGIEEEENYFVGKKGGKKAKKVTGGEPTTTTPTGNLNLPFSTLSALLQLGIPAPVSYADLEQTVEDLGTKKKYFEANQERVTKENIEAAEAKIKASQAKGGKFANGSTEAHEEPTNEAETEAAVETEAVAETEIAVEAEAVAGTENTTEEVEATA